MQTRPWTPARRQIGPRLISGLLLLTPAAVLASAAIQSNSSLLACGAVAQLLAAALLIRPAQVWRPPTSAALITLYVMALGWLGFTTGTTPDALALLTRGGMILICVGLIVLHDFARTGLGSRRRAALWTRRLLMRTRWPRAVAEYQELPEVRVLADALADDPAPAIRPLTDSRPEVRLAILTALAARPCWRPGEADLVLTALAVEPEATVRAAGVLALANATEPEVVADLTAYLRDRSGEVRQAALTALVSGPRNRWPLIREAVREALADPTLEGDGGLTETRLGPLAACDLTAWAAEPEPLAGRAIRTLIAHYAQELRASRRHALPAEIARQVTDNHTPPALRVELAQLLRGLNLITPDLLDRMTDIDQPAPLRVLAAEMLLAWNPLNTDAADVLRGLGRQSNRDTALAIARLLQKYLKLDMGLPRGDIPANGRLAAEVAKRVLQWATARPQPPAAPPTLEPASRAIRLPGLRPVGLTKSHVDIRPPV